MRELCDNFHNKNRNRYHRISVSSASIAKAVKDDYPEVENTARFKMREEIIRHNNQQVMQPGYIAHRPFFPSCI